MGSRCNLPPLVTGITASLDKSNNLLLTWNRQGCDVMSYYVLIKKSTEVWSGANKYVVKKSRSHILIKKMPPGDYEIQIFATNRYGLSKPSDKIALKVEIGGRTGKKENHHEDEVIKLSKETLMKHGHEKKENLKSSGINRVEKRVKSRETSDQEEKFLENSVVCPTCLKVVAIRNFFNHGCQMPRLTEYLPRTAASQGFTAAQGSTIPKTVVEEYLPRTAASQGFTAAQGSTIPKTVVEEYLPRTAASQGFTAAQGSTIPKTVVEGATASPTPAKPNRGAEQSGNSHATASPSRKTKTIEGFYKDLSDLEEHAEKAIFKLQSSVFENQEQSETILCDIVIQQQITIDTFQKNVKLTQKEKTLKDAVRMIQKWKAKLKKLKEDQTGYRRQLMAAQEEAREYLSNHEEKIHGLVEGVMADLRKELEELDF